MGMAKVKVDVGAEHLGVAVKGEGSGPDRPPGIHCKTRLKETVDFIVNGVDKALAGTTVLLTIIVYNDNAKMERVDILA